MSTSVTDYDLRDGRRRPLSFKALIAAFAISTLLFLPLTLWLLGVRAPGADAPVPLPPSISQIQALSELATTNVHISDSIEGENSHYVGRWALHGEVILSVDLSTVKYIKTDQATKRATIHLAQPHILSSKVDHERSHEMSVTWKSWIPPTSSSQILRDEVWKQADRKLQRLGEEPGYTERAKV